MKKTIISIHLIISVILILSCNSIRSNHNDPDSGKKSLVNISKNKIDNVIIRSNQTFDSWQSQLDFLKKESYLNFLKNNNLTLISYELQAKEYVGVFSYKYVHINLESNFSFTIYDSRNHIDDPLIISLLKKRRDEFINKFKDNDLRVVKLLWKYKDEYFYTDCIISLNPSNVVYDDIISNLNFVEHSLPPAYSK